MAKLIFRKFEEGKLRSVSSGQPIVDVHYNDEVLTALETSTLQPDTRLACVHWGMAGDSYTSTLTGSATEGATSEDTALCDALFHDKSLLRTLIADLYKKYGGRLLLVKIRPILFIFTHRDRKLAARNCKGILSLIRRLFSNTPKLDIKFKTNESRLVDIVCPHGDSESTTATNETGKRLDDPHQDIFEKTFASLEDKLSKQRENFETQFSLQTSELNDLDAKIEKVLEKLDQIESENDIDHRTKKTPSDQGLRENSKENVISSGKESGNRGGNDSSSTSETVLLSPDPSDTQASGPPPRRGPDMTNRKSVVGTVVSSSESITFGPDTTTNARAHRAHPPAQPGREKVTGKPNTDDDEAMARRLQMEAWGDEAPVGRYDHPDLQQLRQASDAGRIHNPPFKQIGPPGMIDSDIWRERQQKLAQSGPGLQSIGELTAHLCETSPDEAPVWIAVREKLSEEANVPRAEMVLDTVLCLDTSGSIGSEALDDMKRYVAEFISGIEDVSQTNHLEENVGLVTFGGVGRVIHRPTIDYGLIRDSLDGLTCGGKSPLHQALMVSIAAVSTALVCNNGGAHVLQRVIILTDGLSSKEHDEYGVDVSTCSQEERMRLVTIARQFGEHFGERDTIQFVWVPIGNADRELLRSFASLCKGKFIECNRMKELCKFQLIRKTAQEVMGSFREHKEIDSDYLNHSLSALAPGLNTGEMEELKELVLGRLAGENNIDYRSVDIFDNINVEANLPPLGCRVKRGPDWIWENQDSGGPGTVINHVKNGGSVYVAWDNGHTNMYRYGVNGSYDVLPDDSCPRQYQHPQHPEIGVQVERGPDWSHGDQDGGPGSFGVIIRIRDRRVMVRWESGGVHEYAFGEEDRYELVMRDAESCLLKETPVEQESVTKVTGSRDQHHVTYVWQRQEGDTWHNYSQEDNRKLMDANNKGMTSCLLTRHGKSYRFNFKTEVERELSGGSKTKVRKVPAP